MRDANGDYHYVPRGSVHKPCPGCAETKTYKRESVCDDCLRDLRLARSIKATHETAKTVDRTQVSVPEAAYQLPYIPHERETASSRHPVLEPIHALMLALAETTTPVYPVLPVVSADRDRNYGGGAYLMQTSHVQAFRDLFVALRAAQERAYSEGRRDGSNLLMRLASGDLTSDEFNNRAARLLEGESNERR